MSKVTNSINYNAQKIKGHLIALKEEIFVSLIIVLVGTASYGAGALSSKEQAPAIKIRQSDSGEILDTSKLTQKAIIDKVIPPANTKGVSSVRPTDSSLTGSIVASKNGVAYYLPGCGGSSRILDKNKVYFSTETEAQSAGYRIAGNCKR